MINLRSVLADYAFTFSEALSTSLPSNTLRMSSPLKNGIFQKKPVTRDCYIVYDGFIRVTDWRFY